eukprot:13728236-Alexandrium_andersonii.AAC.1
MRGVVGHHWSKAKESDATLGAAYKECGRSYSAQRQFRADWCAKKYGEIKEKRLKRTSFKRIDSQKGVYEPFNRMVQLEGDGAEGLRAATIYMKKCLANFDKGLKCGG